MFFPPASAAAAAQKAAAARGYIGIIGCLDCDTTWDGNQEDDCFLCGKPGTKAYWSRERAAASPPADEARPSSSAA